MENTESLKVMISPTFHGDQLSRRGNGDLQTDMGTVLRTKKIEDKWSHLVPQIIEHWFWMMIILQ